MSKSIVTVTVYGAGRTIVTRRPRLGNPDGSIKWVERGARTYRYDGAPGLFAAIAAAASARGVLVAKQAGKG